MNPFHSMIELGRWGARDTAYNLGFIPADKLDWKPAPTASSALEIVNHVVEALKSMQPILGGGEFTHPEFTKATTLEEAQQLLMESTESYLAALQALPPDQLGRMVPLPWGEMPLPRVAIMPIVDIINHHGQINYIQSLLGDTDYHFAEEKD